MRIREMDENQRSGWESEKWMRIREVDENQRNG